MPRGWKVITEVCLIKQVQGWGRSAQRKLFAIQELFAEEGPEAFELHAEAFTEGQSWDQLNEPCPLEFFVHRAPLCACRTGILPGRTIVFRRAKRE